MKKLNTKAKYRTSLLRSGEKDEEVAGSHLDREMKKVIKRNIRSLPMEIGDVLNNQPTAKQDQLLSCALNVTRKQLLFIARKLIYILTPILCEAFKPLNQPMHV